jgi:uncharacterized protein
MIYYPDNQDFNNCIEFKDYEKKNYNGTRFYFKNNSENIIIHYHGNYGSACDRNFYKKIFEQSNNSIIFVEYAGYSNDSKKPSKKLILEDVENINDFILKNNFKKIIIYGESLGSGAASYHSYIGNVDILILITPFSTFKDLVKSKYKIFPVSIFLTERYDNIKWLKNYKNDLIIIHGDKDLVIPHYFSKQLYDTINSDKKKYILIKGKGHNNLLTSEEFTKNILKIIKDN